MNILPKKRWHVRTKDNIARVRKDEAQAAEESKIVERRAKIAEQEARTSSLRSKARDHYDGRDNSAKEEEEVVALEGDKPGHVNFFQDVEDGFTVHSGHNKDYEKEKKEEKEQYEKKIGYLTYLGQDTEESTGTTSWYTRVPSSSDRNEKEVNVSSKQLVDPLNFIKRCLGEDDKKGKVKGSTAIQSSTSKKRKCNDNYDRLLKKKSKVEGNDKSKIDLNELRRKRILREQQEKLRAAQLLGKIQGKVEPETKPAAPAVQQKYSSQFNPHLARQNFE